MSLLCICSEFHTYNFRTWALQVFPDRRGGNAFPESSAGITRHTKKTPQKYNNKKNQGKLRCFHPAQFIKPCSLPWASAPDDSLLPGYSEKGEVYTSSMGSLGSLLEMWNPSLPPHFSTYWIRICSLTSSPHRYLRSTRQLNTSSSKYYSGVLFFLNCGNS